MEKLSQISLTCLLAFLIAAKIGNKSGGNREFAAEENEFWRTGDLTWAEKGKAVKKHHVKN